MAALVAVYGEPVIRIFFTGQYTEDEQADLVRKQIDILNIEIKHCYMQLGGYIVHGNERKLYTRLGCDSMEEFIISRGIGKETVDISKMLFRQSVYLVEAGFEIAEVESLYTRPKARQIERHINDMRRQIQISPLKTAEQELEVKNQFFVDVSEVLNTPDFELVRDEKKGETTRPEVYVRNMRVDPESDRYMIATIRIPRTALAAWARGQVEYKIILQGEAGVHTARDISGRYAETDAAEEEDGY